MKAESPGAPSFELPALLLEAGYRLRAECEADLPFLHALYASTREDELAAVPWTPDQKQAFLAQQFDAQHRHYRNAIPDCRFDVLEHRCTAIGRLYLQQQPTRLHLVDIALLPAWRGRGIGSALLRALQARARESGRGVGIMVGKSSTAQHWYRRLGFGERQDHGIFWEMEWRAGNLEEPASGRAPLAAGGDP